MNTTTFKKKSKKAVQYTVFTPGIAIGTLAYATTLGLKHIVLTTGKTVKSIGVDTFNNTVSYVDDLRD
jgi:hypothetical protein